MLLRVIDYFLRHWTVVKSLAAKSNLMKQSHYNVQRYFKKEAISSVEIKPKAIPQLVTHLVSTYQQSHVTMLFNVQL